MIRKPSLQCAADLLRRPLVSQHVDDHLMEVSALDQLAPGPTQRTGCESRCFGIIGSVFNRTPPKFPAQLNGNGTKAQTLALQEPERNAVGGTEVMVVFFHGDTVLD